MPSKELEENQLVIGKQSTLAADSLPEAARKSVSRLSLLGTFA
jgi:hypothetical protein